MYPAAAGGEREAKVASFAGSHEGRGRMPDPEYLISRCREIRPGNVACFGSLPDFISPAEFWSGWVSAGLKTSLCLR